MIKKVGRDIDSATYWKEHATEYANALSDQYHAHRLQVIRSLTDSFDHAGKRVLDFGSGDGVMLSWFPKASEVIGIEPDPSLFSLAREALPAANLLQGSVEQLRAIDSRSVDLFLCFNVAAYFTSEEESVFYEELGRCMAPGGSFMITHSNSLFDMFTFNAFTVEFFRDHFGADVSTLLTNPEVPQRITYNVRENPLAYRFKLARFGLQEVRQEFIHYHPVPPLLGSAKAYRNTLEVAEDARWTLMFQCSTFASHSVLKDPRP